MRIASGLIVALLGLGCCGVVEAGTWSAAIEAGYVEHIFEPEYDFKYDRADKSYENHAHGLEVRLAGTYDLDLDERASVELSAYVGMSDAAWELSTDEPARLTYEIPYSVGLIARPTVAIGGGLSAFVELGIGQGLVKQEKDSPVSSSYDADEWLMSLSLGAGISYDISETISIFAVCRETQYDDLSYKTYLPDGTHRETITDEPESKTVSGGVRVSF